MLALLQALPSPSEWRPTHRCRWGRKPDGVCLVVGGLASGFDPSANTTGDLIYTASHLQPAGDSETARLQYFWWVGGGRGGGGGKRLFRVCAGGGGGAQHF